MTNISGTSLLHRIGKNFENLKTFWHLLKVQYRCRTFRAAFSNPEQGAHVAMRTLAWMVMLQSNAYSPYPCLQLYSRQFYLAEKGRLDVVKEGRNTKAKPRSGFTILLQRTILRRQLRDSHVQNCNPCMIRSKYDRYLEYSKC